MDSAACDRLAWEAICDWPRRVGMAADAPPVLRSRWFLWDKVGRGIRAAVDPEGAAFETGLLGRAVADEVSAAPATARRWHWRLTGERLLRRRCVLYCPFPYSRHARILETLIRAARNYVVVVPAAHAAIWPGAVGWNGGWSTDGGKRKPEGENAEALTDAIIKGLEAPGVRLLECDAQRLGLQLKAQVGRVAEAAAALDALRPDALLLPGDNHPPFIEYALAARARQIPVIMLQHGLDCERFYLDDAYATHIACWGPDRAERYRRDSAWTPQALPIVGNPHYDDPRGADLPAGDPRTWLWVTRPHRPEKCYAPSRLPREGMVILDALLQGLRRTPDATLWIKPHPFDYADRYRDHLAAVGADRVRVTDDTVENLVAGAGVVISEDSTAGMDALRAGRVLVHAHLAASPPVVPFVECGAALPGFSPEVLAEAPRRAMDLEAIEQKRMREGREAFLDAHAGPRDSRAATRFAEFVEDVLNRC